MTSPPVDFSKLNFKRIDRANLFSYKPISDYGLIGDTRSCALIGNDGSIDWLCIPRFDSPSVFGALLDSKKGGRFLVCPAAKFFHSAQSYEPMTNVLRTIFLVGEKSSNLATVTDFMPCFTIERTLVTSGEVHRRIETLRGNVEFEAWVEPRPGYGALVPDVKWLEGIGYTFSSEGDTGNQSISLLTQMKFDEKEKGILTTKFELKEGEKIDLVLRYGMVMKDVSIDPHSELKLLETRAYWKRWIEKCNIGGKWRDQVLRSALALKLLFFSPTGAILAAATTSLPEEIGGSRNWDYRYSWIRDSSFVIWAFHALGFNDEADLYLDWLLSAFSLTIGNLQPMIGISGGRELAEKVVPDLAGYKGSSPVRVGNDAWKQFQLDLYGIFVDALYFSHRHGRGIDRKVFDYLITLVVGELERLWTKPDCGIWEVRSEEQHFVYSKMWAWVGVDRAQRIAQEIGYPDLAEKWSVLRDRIRESILSNGFDPTMNSFVRVYGTKDLDAANLLMPQVRFIAADDPKMIGTIDATMNKLLIDGKFVYRYLVGDGLPGKEGAFLICSFWLVNCLTMAGRLDEAEKILDSVSVYANQLGLFSEEVDPESGELLGNFPQAFTHMGFITAAVNLSKEIEKVAREK